MTNEMLCYVYGYVYARVVVGPFRTSLGPVEFLLRDNRHLLILVYTYVCQGCFSTGREEDQNQ